MKNIYHLLMITSVVSIIAILDSRTEPFKQALEDANSLVSLNEERLIGVLRESGNGKRVKNYAIKILEDVGFDRSAARTVMFCRFPSRWAHVKDWIAFANHLDERFGILIPEPFSLRNVISQFQTKQPKPVDLRTAFTKVWVGPRSTPQPELALDDINYRGEQQHCLPWSNDENSVDGVLNVQVKGGLTGSMEGTVKVDAFPFRMTMRELGDEIKDPNLQRLSYKDGVLLYNLARIPEIDDLTLLQAILVLQQRTERNVDVAGIVVPVSTFTVVVPLILFALLLYLVVHVYATPRNPKRREEAKGDDWIGLFDTKWAQELTYISLSVPLIAEVFTIWASYRSVPVNQGWCERFRACALSTIVFFLSCWLSARLIKICCKRLKS